MMSRTARRIGIVLALAITAVASGIAQQPSADSTTPTPLLEMVETERAFAAKALMVGWKDAFLEYFADEAVGFQGGAAGLAKDQISKAPDPPKGSALIWEPRYGDVASSGEMGYLTGPSTSRAPGRPERHQTYASVWKRQRNGSFKVVLDVGVPTPKPVPFAPGVQRAPAANRFTGDYDDTTPPLSAADGVLNSALKSGQSRAYRGRLAPDARLLRTGSLPVVGEQRIVAWLGGQPRYRLADSRYAEAARSGDLGYTWGTYQLAARSGGTAPNAGAKIEEGFYARVWTRQRNGQWQVALDVLQPQ
jgi:ketosteroid isomerase-like protein